MSFRLRHVVISPLVLAAALALFASALPASAHSLGIQPVSHAQATTPTGIVAFTAADAQQNVALYVMNLASGQVGHLDSPVTLDASLAWRPDGEVLAYTTQDGGYGLLRSLRDCFESGGLCSDLVEVVPPFVVQHLAWSPDGQQLVLATDEGVKTSPPRGRPADMTDLGLNCPSGLAASPTSTDLFCAASGPGEVVQPTVYRSSPSGYTTLYTVGQFPAITALALGPDGRSAVGTLEEAGDSGFYTTPAGVPARLANYQVHVYDLAFSPDGATLAIAGATADSTGDGTLRDGDAAELFLYNPATGLLLQIPGFTGASALAWSPDGAHLLVIVDGQEFLVYTPATNLIATVQPQNFDPALRAAGPAWNAAQAEESAAVPTLPAFVTATPIPTPTSAATLTPFPTFTPYPSPTPYVVVYPTFTPFPTTAPYPTTTPGSPLGVGCQYVYPGGGPPVAVGDTAEVTTYGTAVRLRTNTDLNATMIRELRAGTRMTILSGPYCSQGYRWWEARMESDGRTGYLADSDPEGYWIKTVTAAPPTESISFYADRYSVPAGQCATIQWDVEGIKEVYFQGTGVVGHDSRIVCPATTTTYVLRIVRLDNSEITQQITILVTAS